MSQLGLFDICSRKHRGNASSKAANPHRKRKQEMLAKILELLTINGPLTGKEIAVMLGKPFNAISGRFSDLKRDGLIFGTGEYVDKSEVLRVRIKP